MTERRSEGRNEEILEPALPIVDSHQHLILRPSITYMTQEYIDDAQAGHNIVGSVYLETRAFERQDGPSALRPLGEVEFANGVAAMTETGVMGNCRVAAGIVGFADMRLGGDIAPLLDRCMAAAPERFRGVRQIMLEFEGDREFPIVIGTRPPTGIMECDGFRPALRELASRGLTYDVAIFHYQLPKLAEVADAMPDMTFVLNHAGLAAGFQLSAADRQAVFLEWRDEMREVAQRPNIVCKIGGLGMPHWGFKIGNGSGEVTSGEVAEVWRPYVETVIELFGADRCMMESNFPPDGYTCGFVPLWNAMKIITRNASDEEKASMYHRTAIRIYRLDLPDLTQCGRAR